VNNDEKEFITQAESNRGFDFTGNRPSIIEVGETWEDPSFDFTGNRPSVIEVGEDPSFDFTGNRPSIIEVGETWQDPSFDFLGGNRKAKKDLRAQGLSRKDARDVVKGKMQNPALRNETAGNPNVEIDPATGMPKTMYGQGDWLNRNWIWLVVGVAVVGGGYYIYKKRK
jgi:hypothetical protein